MITSANVTIDLAGFAIDGAGAALIGIYSKRDNVTIRGGTIIRFTAYGNQGTGNSWIIENMRVASNGADGINVADTMRIVGNIVSQNTGYRITSYNVCYTKLLRAATIHPNLVSEADPAAENYGGTSYNFV